jgi:hypothetical protein
MEVERESGASGASGPDPSGKGKLNNKKEEIRLREKRNYRRRSQVFNSKSSRNSLAVLVHYE